MFYVYELKDSRDGEVFYIGKGTGDRLNEHASKVRKNRIPHNNIRLYNRIAEIVDSGNKVEARKILITADAGLCFEVEAILINEYGTVRLCNKANPEGTLEGGKCSKVYEDVLGYVYSEEDRKRRSFLINYDGEYRKLRNELYEDKRSLITRKDSRKVTLRKKTNKCLEEINKYKKKWEEEISSINMNRSIFDGVVF